MCEELTKERGVCAWVKISKKLVTFVQAAFLSLNNLSGDKDASYPPTKGSYLHMGDLIPAFRGTSCKGYFLTNFNSK